MPLSHGIWRTALAQHDLTLNIHPLSPLVMFKAQGGASHLTLTPGGWGGCLCRFNESLMEPLLGPLWKCKEALS